MYIDFLNIDAAALSLVPPGFPSEMLQDNSRDTLRSRCDMERKPCRNNMHKQWTCCVSVYGALYHVSRHNTPNISKTTANTNHDIFQRRFSEEQISAKKHKKQCAIGFRF